MNPCYDCGARPGQTHRSGCHVEICTVDGYQHCWCKCIGHEPEKARWRGELRGQSHADALPRQVQQDLEGAR